MGIIGGKMAGPENELNKYRPTICKNCVHFNSRIDPYQCNGLICIFCIFIVPLFHMWK